MALHRLTSIALGVPDAAAVGDYYEQFGLVRGSGGLFTTEDGGSSLTLEPAQHRQLRRLGVGADDPDDIARIDSALAALGIPAVVARDGRTLRTREPVAGFVVEVGVAPRHSPEPAEPVPLNGPGRAERPNVRAPGILRTGPVRPHRLGHVVIGTTDRVVTQRFFVEGLGFRVSDTVKEFAAFLRCSPDHHNVFVQAAPVNFLHHTAWEVDDVDEVGRGAMGMLEGHPERHGWGPGRHFLGSNFFWYLRDPAGNFAEYFSDMDAILDDQLWTPDDWEGVKAMYAWGPEPSPSFLQPEDVVARIVGAHSAG
ncbi:VOC family protein [Pseudonocardia xishanensis]|uniref:VOC family protein n=1 Tax=Pseudonocardia xishanensis TaxID=630995 RepID=A0ABP8RF09_9PSEU